MTNALVWPQGLVINQVVTSAQLNQLDQFVANSIDKTGETSGTGGGVSGEIDWLSGSSITLKSGAVLALNSGSLINGNIQFTGNSSGFSNPKIFQASPASDGISTGTMTIQSCNANPLATVDVNGGNLLLSTGNPTPGGARAVPGTLELQLGNGGSALNVLSASSLITTLYGGGAGTMVLEAASISCWPGSGALLSNPLPYVAASANTILPFLSATSLASQSQVNFTVPIFLSTTASGSNVAALNFTIPSNTMAFIEVCWVRRELTTGAGDANRAAQIAWASATGVIGLSNSGTPVIAYSGYDSAGTLIFSSPGANTVLLTVAAQSLAMDWQLTVSVLLN